MKKYSFINMFAVLLLSCYSTANAINLPDYDFGDVPIGQEALFNFEVRNNFDDKIELLKIEVIGGNNSFSILNFTPIRLQPNQASSYQIRFYSDDNVAHQGFLRLRFRENLGEYSYYSVVKANAVHSNPHYSSTNNLKGQSLLGALKSLVVGHKVLTYTEARTAMYASIDNFDGFVECVYSGRKVAATGIPNVNVDKFDTEHTWPQSFGADVEPPKSDIYHMRPTFQLANSRRANFPYGYVVSNVTYEDGGSRLGRDANNEIVFEPRENVRGDVARGLFYFALRYGNIGNYIDYQEQTLRDFMLKDPVDELELARGEAIYSYQNNRNPFIDYNQFIYRFNSFANPDIPKKAIIEIADDTLFVIKQSGVEFPLYVLNIGDTLAYLSATIDGHNLAKQNFTITNSQTPIAIEANNSQLFKIKYENIHQTQNDEIAFISLLLESGDVKRVYLMPKDYILSNEQYLMHDFDFSIFPNPLKNYAVISLSGVEFYDDVRITYTSIDGKQYDLNYVRTSSNQILLNKSDFNCSNCLLYISIEQAGSRITKPIFVE